MTLAILSLLSAILGFIFFLVRRQLAKPVDKIKIAHETVSREIMRDDAIAASKRLDDWLRTLQSIKRGQGDSARKSSNPLDNKP